MPKDGAAPKPDAVLLLLLPPLPKMLLVVVGAAVVAVGATAPKENAPVLLVVLLGCCEAAPPKEKPELAAGGWPKAGLLAAPPPNMPEEGGEVAEVVELLEMVPKGGGAVVGGADAANPPPKAGAADVVMVEPNEGAEVEAVVVDPKPNFGTAGAPPKAGADTDAVRAGAPEVAPPNVNALVVDDGIVVATAAAVVGFKVEAPKAKPPPEVVVAITPVVDAATLPNDGILEALVVTAADEAVVGERGLNALNPDPLPKVGMVDWLVLRVF